MIFTLILCAHVRNLCTGFGAHYPTRRAAEGDYDFLNPPAGNRRNVCARAQISRTRRTDKKQSMAHTYFMPAWHSASLTHPAFSASDFKRSKRVAVWRTGLELWHKWWNIGKLHAFNLHSCLLFFLSSLFQSLHFPAAGCIWCRGAVFICCITVASDTGLVAGMHWEVMLSRGADLQTLARREYDFFFQYGRNPSKPVTGTCGK